MKNTRKQLFLALFLCCAMTLLVLLLIKTDIKDGNFSFGLRSEDDSDYDYNFNDYDYNWFFNGSNSSVLVPTPTPQADTTCQALQQLAYNAPSSSVFSCDTNDQCTGLHCTSRFGVFDMVIEPCETPPAVNVSWTDSFGNSLFQDTLTGSRVESVGFVDVNITLEQTPDEDSIVISVVVTPTILFTGPIVLIPRTRIPLNREQCGFTPPPVSQTSFITSSTSRPMSLTRSHIPPLTTTYVPDTTSAPENSLPVIKSTRTQPSTTHTLETSSSPSSQPSTTHIIKMSSSPSPQPPTEPTLGGQSNTIAIAVPVSLVFSLLFVVVLVILIVFAMRKRKQRRREYHFQRMTFSNVRDDDDDDDDDDNL